MDDEYFQPHDEESESEIGGDRRYGPRPRKTFHPGVADSLKSKRDEPDRKGQPDGGVLAQEPDRTEPEHGDWNSCREQNAQLAMCDPLEVGTGHPPAQLDALRKAVGVEMRDPDDEYAASYDGRKPPRAMSLP